MVAHIILFEHSNFYGYHYHIFQSTPVLSQLVNDMTSSIVVLEGTWIVYADKDYGGRYSQPLGPGLYPTPADFNLPDNWLSSVKLINP